MEGLLSGNLLSKASIFGGSGSSNIKSRQSGTLTTSTSVVNNDVTIPEVDLTKSILRISTYPVNPQGSPNTDTIYAELINATTVRVYGAGNTYTSFVFWEVIEFNNVKSIQSGTKTQSPAATTATVTISSVNLTKSTLFFSYKNQNLNTNGANFLMSGYISGETTITFKWSVSATAVMKWYVVEFN